MTPCLQHTRRIVRYSIKQNLVNMHAKMMQFKARNSGWCLPIAPTQLVDVEDMSPTTKKTAMIALLMMSAAMGEKL